MFSPPKVPCGSCPYRRDVPSGIWSAEEYAKLPRYDLETPEQPTGVFLCHQRDGCLCGGWIMSHKRHHLLSLRLAAMRGDLDPAVWSYAPEVEVFGSGQEAAWHGLQDIAAPGPEAQRVMRGLGRLPRFNHPAGDGND